ncbi:hypothetical protein ACQKNX_22355 [Lysinibacillus sp. NPDC093712]|uniref:hypothetical protein n=1 Tax=Lysinibacillus sp. NPDC093712 TaxID=3390579 RepID=UPI003D06F981
MKFALNEVPKEKLAAGAGLFSFIRDFGTPLDSVSGIVLFSIFKDTACKETLLASTTEAGSEHSAALLAAGQTVTDENCALAEHLTSLGVSFESIFTTATAAGLTSAVHTIDYIAMALFAIILFLYFLIPKAKKAPVLAVIASGMVVVEETVS